MKNKHIGRFMMFKIKKKRKLNENFRTNVGSNESAVMRYPTQKSMQKFQDSGMAVVTDILQPRKIISQINNYFLSVVFVFNSKKSPVAVKTILISHFIYKHAEYKSTKTVRDFVE